MAAPPAPPGMNVRQYNIVMGGLDGAATGTLRMQDLLTNMDYYAGTRLPCALLFSKGDFTSEHYITGPNVKSLYAVFLQSLQYLSHASGLPEATVRAACVLATARPSGTIIRLDWGNTVSFLRANGTLQTIRPEECGVQAPDSPPPQDRHGGVVPASERRRVELQGLLRALSQVEPKHTTQGLFTEAKLVA